MTLDDKLRDTLERVYLRGKYEQQGLVAAGTLDIEGFITQIKKVFFEDDKTSYIADFSKGKLSKLMTGQEWLGRFRHELLESRKLGISEMQHALEVAYTASGIKE